MQNTAGSFLIQVLAGSVVYFLILVFTSWVVLPAGQLHISNRFTLIEKEYVQISIENFSGHELNKIKIIAPSVPDGQGISTDQTVEINVEHGQLSSQAYNIVLLSGVKPHSLTRLFLPMPMSNDVECCDVPNASDLNLRVNKGSSASTPYKDIITNSALTSVVVAILYALTLYWTSTMVRKSQSESRIIDEELRKVTEKLHKVEEELKDIRLIGARHRAVLLRRISDYRKELEFWRDSIRKAIYQRRGNDLSDGIIFEITKKLGTYGTADSRIFNDAEALQVVSDVVKEEG